MRILERRRKYLESFSSRKNTVNDFFEWSFLHRVQFEWPFSNSRVAFNLADKFESVLVYRAVGSELS